MCRPCVRRLQSETHRATSLRTVRSLTPAAERLPTSVGESCYHATQGQRRRLDVVGCAKVPTRAVSARTAAAAAPTAPDRAHSRLRRPPILARQIHDPPLPLDPVSSLVGRPGPARPRPAPLGAVDSATGITSSEDGATRGDCTAAAAGTQAEAHVLAGDGRGSDDTTDAWVSTFPHPGTDQGKDQAR